jgi:hypothetical protein
MTESRLDRAIQVVVFAPLGAGLYALEAAPKYVETFVARGRAEVEARQEQLTKKVTTVRSTGQVALAFGLPKLRNRARRWLGRAAAVAPVPGRPSTPRAGPGRGSGAPSEPTHASWVPAPNGTSVTSNGTAPAATEDAPASSELPIPGYDALSASQVVERLAGLPAADLDAVRAYETTHRSRRTILGKIEQLAAPGA